MYALHQNAFLLLNIAYARGEFFRLHSVSFDPPDDDLEMVSTSYYFSWLRNTVSELLIDSAIKTRVLLDTVLAEEFIYKEAGEKYAPDVRKADADICSRILIGASSSGSTVASIREMCNKIIHAEDWLLMQGESAEGSLTWNGNIHIQGMRRGKAWVVVLCLAPFCLALEELLRLLEDEVDWHSIHKYSDPM